MDGLFFCESRMGLLLFPTHGKNLLVCPELPGNLSAGVVRSLCAPATLTPSFFSGAELGVFQVFLGQLDIGSLGTGLKRLFVSCLLHLEICVCLDTLSELIFSSGRLNFSLPKPDRSFEAAFGKQAWFPFLLYYWSLGHEDFQNYSQKLYIFRLMF